MKTTLRYVSRDTDRYGNVRLYFRREGKKVRLKGPEGSPEFLEEYRLALTGNHPKQRTSAVAFRANAGSMRELIEEYYSSAAFRTLAPRTRRVRKGILDNFCARHGDGEKPHALLESKHLLVRRDELCERPEAANSLIKALRQVFKFGVTYGHCTSNPASDVEMLESFGDGIAAWHAEQVEAFERTHPIGTTARLSMSLALFTGQRRSDLVKLGRQHLVAREGREWLHFTQEKNRRRKPVEMWIPVASELREILDASPTGDMTFIQSEHGRPYTYESFGNRFRKWCREAGLEGYSVHGLRKTASAVLAENHCTEQEIMAITGHSTSKEIIRYTRSARQKVRAMNAIEKMTARSTK